MHDSGLKVICISNYPTLLSTAIAPGKALNASGDLKLVAHPCVHHEKANLVDPFWKRSDLKVHTCVTGILFNEEATHRALAYREDISRVTLEQIMNQLYEKWGEHNYCDHFNTRNETHCRALERFFKGEYPQYGEMTIVFVN